MEDQILITGNFIVLIIDLCWIKISSRFDKQVHGVIFVVKADDPRLTNETYLDRMKIIRNHFQFIGNIWVIDFFYLNKT